MVDRRNKNRGRTTDARPAPYTSRIIKAGALLADTRALLASWDVSVPVEKNLQRLRRQNLFGKASRSRVEDILGIFRQRYLAEEAVLRALVALTKGGFSSAALDRALYFHAARADLLLHHTVTEFLLPLQTQGVRELDINDIQATVAKWVDEGKTTTRWGENTILRVSQGLLSTLRDFGILNGAVKKRIAPAYVPVEAFAYVMFYLKQEQPSGAELLAHPEWRLFFLSREAVERLLIEAQQRDLLEYHAAGSVTRLTFPAATLEEYARVLADGTH